VTAVPRRVGRSGRLVAGLLLPAGLLAAGCSSVGSAVRPAVPADICAVALPVGGRLAGPGARLVQVERLDRAHADRLLAALGAPPLTVPGAAATPASSPGQDPTRGCALAYAGSFSTSSLPPGLVRSGPPTGRGLVLLVSTRHPRAVRAVVLPDAPRRLPR